jgi:hypothetical protein
MSEPSNPTDPARPRQVALGLFILGQLAFLVVSTGLGFVRDASKNAPAEVLAVADAVAPGWSEEKGHAWEWSSRVVTDLRGWAEATGQLQEWSLFAPDISRESGFPAVVLRWDDAAWSAAGASELLRSDNEPADPRHYFRVGRFRERRVENAVMHYFVEFDDETPGQRAARWDKELGRHVRNNAILIRAYLRGRLEECREHHPDKEAPRQVILVERIWRMTPAEDGSVGWSGPVTTPLARWRPGDDAVERYSLRHERFEDAAP